jgi:hypothetical protein
VNRLFAVSGAALTVAGVDPVDDFVDGVFTADNAANGNILTPSSLSIKSTLLRVQKSWMRVVFAAPLAVLCTVRGLALALSLLL